MTAASPRDNPKLTRNVLTIAGTLTAFGLAMNLGSDSTFAKLVTVAGLLLLLWSIHRFGRLGPDAPIIYAENDTPRRKRKKRGRPAPDETGSR